MPLNHKSIVSLLEYVKIDKFDVVCHFKCRITNKTIVSIVPFEPYSGKIEITWQDMLLSPIKSYNRYYHTPITIYNQDCKETIVLKAFEKIAKYFEYNSKIHTYVYILKKV